MKKEILEALKAKFSGVSESILGRIADKLAKTASTQEQVTPAVEGVTFQQVLESYGDSRATEAQQTAVSNYEKKHGLREGQKVEGGAPKTEPDKNTPPAGGGDLASQITEAVKAAVKPLQDEIAALKTGKVTETRRQTLDAIISKLPEDLRKPYARTPVNDMSDEEFEALTGEIQTEVEGLVTATTVRGAVFGRPAGGAQAGPKGKEATEEEASKVIERLGI